MSRRQDADGFAVVLARSADTSRLADLVIVLTDEEGQPAADPVVIAEGTGPPSFVALLPAADGYAVFYAGDDREMHLALTSSTEPTSRELGRRSQPAVATTPDGYVVASIVDNDMRIREVRVLLLDAAGTPTAAFPLVPATTHQEGPSVAQGHGTIGVLYGDQTPPATRFAALKPDGSLSTAPSLLASEHVGLIRSDGADGFVASWVTTEGMRMLRVDATGAPVWDEPVLIEAAHPSQSDFAASRDYVAVAHQATDIGELPQIELELLSLDTGAQLRRETVGMRDAPTCCPTVVADSSSFAVAFEVENLGKPNAFVRVVRP